MHIHTTDDSILLALQSQSPRVAEAHWKAFCLYHGEKRPVAEVAAGVGLGVANVYKIRGRITRQLKEETGHG